VMADLGYTWSRAPNGREADAHPWIEQGPMAGDAIRCFPSQQFGVFLGWATVGRVWTPDHFRRAAYIVDLEAGMPSGGTITPEIHHERAFPTMLRAHAYFQWLKYCIDQLSVPQLHALARHYQGRQF